MFADPDQRLQPSHCGALVHPRIGDIDPVLLGHHYIGIVIEGIELASDVRATPLLVIDGDLDEIGADLVKVPNGFDLAVGAAHQLFQVGRDILSDEGELGGAGDGDVRARHPRELRYDGQPQAVL
ncbi:hypothetical protein D3C78_1503810 [compost metagenome]